MTTVAKKSIDKIMVKINLETNPLFKEEMANLGFKKIKGEFVSRNNDATNLIVWGYATKGEKHVRYYFCSCMVEYPAVLEIAEKLDVMVHPIGTNIGYVMPKNRFTEWEIRESYSEKKLISVMNDIIKSIEKYAMPYFERISTIDGFIKTIEQGKGRGVNYDDKLPPILYRLLGNEEKAQKYIEQTLKKLSAYEEPQSLFEVKETKDYCQVTFQSAGNRNLEIYEDFAQKFNSSKDVFTHRIGGLVF